MSSVKLILKNLVNDNIAGLYPAATAMSIMHSDLKHGRCLGRVMREARSRHPDLSSHRHLNLVRRSPHGEKSFLDIVIINANLRPMMEDGSLSLQADTVKEPANPGESCKQLPIEDSQKVKMLASPVEVMAEHEDMANQGTAGPMLDPGDGQDVKEEVRMLQSPLTGRPWISALPGALLNLEGPLKTALIEGGHEEADSKQNVISGCIPDCDLDRLKLGFTASDVCLEEAGDIRPPHAGDNPMAGVNFCESPRLG